MNTDKNNTQLPQSSVITRFFKKLFCNHKIVSGFMTVKSNGTVIIKCNKCGKNITASWDSVNE